MWHATKCLFKFDFWANLDGHPVSLAWGHWNGRCPVWVRRWSKKLCSLMNVFWQVLMSHLNNVF